MWKATHALRGPYAIAVGAVGAASVLAVPLAHVNPTPSSVFLAAVAVSAWYGGLGPGILATILSALALDALLLASDRPMPGSELTASVRLALFVVVAALISGLNATWQQREARFQQQERRKDEFLAVLAHELRNPLSPILYSLHALRESKASAATLEEAGQVLERQVHQLARLTEDLLDLCRARMDKMQLRVEQILLASVVEEAIAAARPLINARDHRLEIRLPAEPVWLEADPARLEQVLVNLLLNAAKYTDAGGAICLTAERQDDNVLLRVCDTGLGLAPAELTQIFEPFTQGQRTARGGMGIGLALVRSLVEMHGGTVAARSAGIGQGSEFEIRLPLQCSLKARSA
jgi:signal transduction histidine kinase